MKMRYLIKNGGPYKLREAFFKLWNNMLTLDDGCDYSKIPLKDTKTTYEIRFPQVKMIQIVIIFICPYTIKLKLTETKKKSKQ